MCAWSEVELWWLAACLLAVCMWLCLSCNVGIKTEVLGKPLDKEQQRSDWAARPLSESQLAYAAADVACLVSVFDALTSDELEEDLEQSGEESSEEDGKEIRKLHRGARGRVQRAEANLNGMVEAYAARGFKGLRMQRLAGFALLVSLPSNPHPFVAYGGYLKNATGRKILAQFVRQANRLPDNAI
eukprot:XP_001690487.1 predicted protein [Chlamydomonas reinhardtii]